MCRPNVTSLLLALLLSRLALLLTGFAARALPINPGYPAAEVRERGWQFTSMHAIDMWARYDSGWFMSIVYDGYWRGLDINQHYSNVAFFPLYPALLRLLLGLLPASINNTPAAQPLYFVLAGVFVSHAMLLTILVLLRKFARELGMDERSTQRAVCLFLLSPFAFFFSCAYSESTFVCMALLCLLMAQRAQWVWAGFFGALAALTRPPGVLILLPCLLRYVEIKAVAGAWPRRPFTASLLPLLGIPAAWLVFLAYLYPITGQVLSPYTAHNAWQEFYTPPWVTLLGFFELRYPFEPIDRAMLLLTLACGTAMLRNRAWRVAGLFTLLMAIAPLWAGTLVSIGRYCAVTFPVMLWMGARLHKRGVFGAVCAVFGLCQLILFAAWTRFYEVM